MADDKTLTPDGNPQPAAVTEAFTPEAPSEVTDVKLQEPFVILGPKGQVVTTWKADFTFWDVKEGRRRVIDVKGVQTPLFKLKKKLVEAFLGIQIELAD